MTLKLGVVGCGIKASQYIKTWSSRDDVAIVAIADPDKKALSHVEQVCDIAGKAKPESYQRWQDLFECSMDSLDAVYICTPHAGHAEQALLALRYNLDVLLEKPMVTTVTEAEALLAAQKECEKQLVVAYQGGLSPLVQQLRQDIQNGTYGELVSINAAIWEDWAEHYQGHWKQIPSVSGGGFMFDTGAHMMNTVSMLCAQRFTCVSAKMKSLNYPVDITTGVLGELADGTVFTMHACGRSIGCQSRIECYFTDCIVRICAWGRWVEVEDASGNIHRQEQEAANNLMNVFMQTRQGKISNPSDILQGLKMAKLWDAVKASAAQGGHPVSC